MILRRIPRRMDDFEEEAEEIYKDNSEEGYNADMEVEAAGREEIMSESDSVISSNLEKKNFLIKKLIKQVKNKDQKFNKKRLI